ncbi:MAG: ammonia monooxygenase [Tessaracoccus sp.]|uniref:DUF6527 family protein n=1 Tax=Tessaracoccus sp. TaxID=1971211 RepID=UPI001EC93331|nr:DUF6527 family protein [Tessaracoccus sp.]MBK7823380.1 ammonia monooxygenase [Tessaracoccus sp.]
MNVVEQRQEQVTNRTACWVWCPGCDDLHAWWIADGREPVIGPVWEFDGNLEQPTVSPSLHVSYGAAGSVCHSFIRSGRWEFLPDSTHPLAGQTIPMIAVTDWPFIP